MKIIAIILLILIFTTSSAQAFDGWTNGNGGTNGISTNIGTENYMIFGSGAIRLEFDWNKNTGEVLRLRCVSHSPGGLLVRIFDTNSSLYAESEIWSGLCLSFSIMTLPVNKFNFTYNGELVTNNYKIEARWPIKIGPR